MKMFAKHSHGRIRMHAIPIVVWTAALLCVGMLFRYRAERFEVIGLVRGKSFQIAATCTGRIQRLMVSSYDDVQAGDPLVVLNTIVENELPLNEINAQIDTAKAELVRLEAEIGNEQQNIEIENIDRIAEHESAKADMMLEQAQINRRVKDVQAALLPDRILLKDYELELKVVKELLDKEAVESYEYDKLKIQYDMVAETIKGNEQLIAQMETDQQKVTARLDELIKSDPVQLAAGPVLKPLIEAVNVQDMLIRELTAQLNRAPLILTAPCKGVVQTISVVSDSSATADPTQVGPQEGDVIMAGDIILTIIETVPTDIIAYADQFNSYKLSENMQTGEVKVQLIKNSYPPQIVESYVKDLGPKMELLPERLWKNPTVPEWGRAVVISVQPGLKLIPGESVGVKGL